MSVLVFVRVTSGRRTSDSGYLAICIVPPSNSEDALGPNFNNLVGALRTSTTHFSRNDNCSMLPIDIQCKLSAENLRYEVGFVGGCNEAREIASSDKVLGFR